MPQVAKAGAGYSGIADGLRAWRWQLAAVRLPPGPEGRESTCPKWRSEKKNSDLSGHTELW